MKNLKTLLTRLFALIALSGGLLFTHRAQAQVVLASEPLIAGQNYVAGTVSVLADAENIYVIYYMALGWNLKETHVAVATSLDGIPTNKKGNPKVGKFPLGESFSGPTDGAIYTIPRSSLGTLDLFAATHAVVSRTTGGGTETAWAGSHEFDGGSWATYMTMGGDSGPPNR